jgi:hypothetical protein
VTGVLPERPVAEADHPGLARLGDDVHAVREAAHEHALQAALDGIASRRLRRGQAEPGGVDLADEAHQLGRGGRAIPAGEYRLEPAATGVGVP